MMQRLDSAITGPFRHRSFIFGHHHISIALDSEPHSQLKQQRTYHLKLGMKLLHCKYCTDVLPGRVSRINLSPNATQSPSELFSATTIPLSAKDALTTAHAPRAFLGFLHCLLNRCPPMCEPHKLHMALNRALFGIYATPRVPDKAYSPRPCSLCSIGRRSHEPQLQRLPCQVSSMLTVKALQPQTLFVRGMAGRCVHASGPF